ncbi:YolD-like family protein [Priestia megaterium]|uniref:YolD-like family protein n=1 Tax=Priestia megaterium TaxID=1404 RepID=UPI001C232FC0|nr:YolD-like family protein [Priestia megaterium]MBU8589182.1 YolD-like family protein [Priestia megaterium]
MDSDGRFNDRGMRKWRPFASMPEQYIGLDEVLKGLNRVEKPILAEDHQEQVNEILMRANGTDKKVSLTYYRRDECITETCTIHSINIHTKALYFVDAVFGIKNKLLLSDVLDIRFV